MSEVLNVETIMTYFEGQEQYKSARIIKKKITELEAGITEMACEAMVRTLQSDQSTPMQRLLSIRLAKDAMDTMTLGFATHFSKTVLPYLKQIGMFKNSDPDPDRGKTYFSLSPDKQQAQIGNSLLRMVLEAIKAWAMWYPLIDEQPSEFIKVYHSLTHQKVSFPQWTYYKDPVRYQSIDFDFTLQQLSDKNAKFYQPPSPTIKADTISQSQQNSISQSQFLPPNQQQSQAQAQAQGLSQQKNIPLAQSLPPEKQSVPQAQIQMEAENKPQNDEQLQSLPQNQLPISQPIVQSQNSPYPYSQQQPYTQQPYTQQPQTQQPNTQQPYIQPHQDQITKSQAHDFQQPSSPAFNQNPYPQFSQASNNHPTPTPTPTPTPGGGDQDILKQANDILKAFQQFEQNLQIILQKYPTNLQPPIDQLDELFSNVAGYLLSVDDVADSIAEYEEHSELFVQLLDGSDHIKEFEKALEVLKTDPTKYIQKRKVFYKGNQSELQNDEQFQQSVQQPYQAPQESTDRLQESMRRIYDNHHQVNNSVDHAPPIIETKSLQQSQDPKPDYFQNEQYQELNKDFIKSKNESEIASQKQFPQQQQAEVQMQNQHIYAYHEEASQKPNEQEIEQIQPQNDYYIPSQILQASNVRNSPPHVDLHNQDEQSKTLENQRVIEEQRRQYQKLQEEEQERIIQEKLERQRQEKQRREADEALRLKLEQETVLQRIENERRMQQKMEQDHQNRLRDQERRKKQLEMEELQQKQMQDEEKRQMELQLKMENENKANQERLERQRKETDKMQERNRLLEEERRNLEEQRQKLLYNSRFSEQIPMVQPIEDNQQSNIAQRTLQNKLELNSRFGLKSKNPSMPKRNLGDFQNLPDLVVEPPKQQGQNNDQKINYLNQHIQDLRTQLDQKEKQYEQIRIAHNESIRQVAEAQENKLKLQGQNYEVEIQNLKIQHINETKILQASIINHQQQLELKDKVIQQKIQDHSEVNEQLSQLKKKYAQVEDQFRLQMEEIQQLKLQKDQTTLKVQYQNQFGEDQSKLIQQELNELKKTILQKNQHIEQLTHEKIDHLNQLNSQHEQLQLHVDQYRQLQTHFDQLKAVHEEKITSHHNYKQHVETTHNDIINKHQKFSADLQSRHQQEIQSLRDELEHTKNMLDIHRTDLNEHKLQKDTLERELIHLQQKHLSKHKEAEAYKQQLMENQDNPQLKSLQIELEEFKARYKELEDQFNEQMGKHSKVLSETAKLQKVHMQQREESHKNTMELKRLMLKHQSQTEQLQSELVQHEETVKQLTFEKSDLEGQLVSLRALSDSQSVQIIKLMTQLTKKKESTGDSKNSSLLSFINNLQEQIKQERSQKSEELKQFEQQKQNELNQLNDRIQYLQMQIQQQEQQIGDLNHQLDLQNQQIRELDVSNQYLQEIIQDRDQHLQQMDIEIQQLQSELASHLKLDKRSSKGPPSQSQGNKINLSSVTQRRSAQKIQY